MSEDVLPCGEVNKSVFALGGCVNGCPLGAGNCKGASRITSLVTNSLSSFSIEAGIGFFIVIYFSIALVATGHNVSMNLATLVVITLLFNALAP
jgi:hypothetical protein